MKKAKKALGLAALAFLAFNVGVAAEQDGYSDWLIKRCSFLQLLQRNEKR